MRNDSRSVKIGDVYGRLTVLREAPERRTPGSPNTSVWECSCSCGKRCYPQGRSLKKGVTQSCGCLHKEIIKKCNNTHGLCETITYSCWAQMLSRCRNPKTAGYADYGGRGIKVCERWHSFENFYADMGERPSKKHSIDRINNDGNYEPGNCRWATIYEQLDNRRSTIWVTYRGVKMPLRVFCDNYDLPYAATKGRLKDGWSLDWIKSLTLP